MKGIDRMDGRGHGWQARFYRNGKPYSRFFSDRKFGGSDNALSAARDYLTVMQKAFPPKSRRTGFTIREGQAPGGLGGMSRFWNVSYRGTDGKLKNKKFYFSNQDERDAARIKAGNFKQGRGEG